MRSDMGDGEDHLSDNSLTEAVQDTALFLWEQDGKPDGREDFYWQRALDQHLRQRAFDIWLREGQPEGRAEEHWHAARQELGQILSKGSVEAGKDQL